MGVDSFLLSKSARWPTFKKTSSNVVIDKLYESISNSFNTLSNSSKNDLNWVE